MPLAPSRLTFANDIRSVYTSYRSHLRCPIGGDRRGDTLVRIRQVGLIHARPTRMILPRENSKGIVYRSHRVAWTQEPWEDYAFGSNRVLDAGEEDGKKEGRGVGREARKPRRGRKGNALLQALLLTRKRNNSHRDANRTGTQNAPFLSYGRINGHLCSSRANRKTRYVWWEFIEVYVC